MRCTECGYNNEKEGSTCTKCGSPLMASVSVGPELAQQRKAGLEGNPTMKGMPAEQPSWDLPAKSTLNGDFHNCPDCSYYPLDQPNSATHPCPNCGSVKATKEASSVAKELSPAAKTRRLENMNFGQESRRITLTDIRSATSKEFEGEKIRLTRSNLDSGNLSISASHADLEFKDGTWFLKDISSNEATFIQVQNPVPVMNGTRIMIGNRIYTIKY